MLKILGLASLLASVACGGGSSGGGDVSTTGSGSCTTNSGGMLVTCTDYGAGFTASTVMQVCATSSMTIYSAAACPSANRVGRCEITETRGGVSAGDAVNFYPPETAAAAMSACAMENGVSGVTTRFVAN
jgi:hypothetical protein